MNKRFLLLFFLVGNSCFGAAAGDEAAEFFRVAEQGRGATSVIVQYLRAISQCPRARPKKKFTGGYINRSNGISGLFRVIDMEAAGYVRVESKMIALQPIYEERLQNDSFTSTKTFGILPSWGVVTIGCMTMVPRTAYLEIINEASRAAGPENPELAG